MVNHTSQQQIAINNQGNSQYIMKNGQIIGSFLYHKSMSCSTALPYIYQDYTHQQYQILFTGVKLLEINGLPYNISYVMTYQQNRLKVTLSNGCPQPYKNQMNRIQIKIEGYGQNIQYFVNCSPRQVYKPFEWGLFILIIICTITITGASFYSRAWAYKGFSIYINKKFLVLFNVILFIGILLAYYTPSLVSIGLKLFGSVLGSIGVMVCVVETLWLIKSNLLKKPLLKFIRLLDIIGLIVGIMVTYFYWLSEGSWLINDVLAVCTIVSCIKIFKLRSLMMGMVLLFTTLLLQILAGLFIHYVLKTSYNNLVINLFESPVVIVFPSITPQLYRRCAWLPLTNVLFPGLVISYLRRFDVSRSTSIYIIVGYLSYYLGTMAWMLVDMQNIHAWPVAIITDPILFLILIGISCRRNQFKTIWKGTFHDDQNPDIKQQLIKNSKDQSDQNKTIGLEIQQLTENIKIDYSSQIEYKSDFQQIDK